MEPGKEDKLKIIHKHPQRYKEKGVSQKAGWFEYCKIHTQQPKEGSKKCWKKVELKKEYTSLKRQSRFQITCWEKGKVQKIQSKNETRKTKVWSMHVQ